MKGSKVLAHILCWVPFIYLVYAIFTNNLGADPQVKVMHDLGLYALIFLLLCLSITPVKLLTGVAGVVRYRRMLGLFCAWYAFLHLLVYFALYLEFGVFLLADEIVKRPYITIGLLAFVILIPLTVTSTKSMQKRLGRKWKRLHSSVYWVALFGLVHLLWQSKSDLNEPLIYVMWATALAGVRLYYRFKPSSITSIN